MTRRSHHQLRSLETYPQANISINRNRVKKHNAASSATIYMVNGTEFEIELDNNTQETWLAKITLNEKLISTSGLVLRPGEHQFIERFLDENRKFLFDTYTVSKGRKKAIANNGKVEIEFFKERKPVMWASLAPTYPVFPTYPTYRRPFFDYDYNYKPFVVNNSGNFTAGWTGSSTPMFSSLSSNCEANLSAGKSMPDVHIESEEPTIRFGKTDLTEKDVKQMKSFMETGRIEKGSESDQEFVNVDIDFETYCSYRVAYQILPLSQKKFVEAKNIRQYCISCGRRRKKSENFCPTDGAKYSDSIPITP